MTYKREPQRPSSAWIVVADRARARIFSSPWPLADSLHEIETLVHPEGKAHERDVLTDGPGRFAERVAGPHSGEPQTDFRHRTALDFATVVAQRLEKGRVTNAFGRLVVIAPALYLGVLREKMSAPLARLVTYELDKDYTQMPAAQLLAQLRKEPALNGGG